MRKEKLKYGNMYEHKYMTHAPNLSRLKSSFSSLVPYFNVSRGNRGVCVTAKRSLVINLAVLPMLAGFTTPFIALLTILSFGLIVTLGGVYGQN